MSHFNLSQAAYIDQDNRNMAAQGFSMSGTLNDIYDTIAAGSIGITALANAVDAVCLSNDHFSRDKVTGPGTSLVFAWFTSHFWNGKQRVTVAAGNLTLAPSLTNYIEVDANGTVSSNTAGFSADGSKYPLWTVLTGPGSYADSAVTNTRCTETFVPKGSLTGSLLSTAQKTVELFVPLGLIATAAGTTKGLIECPSSAGTITRVSLVDGSALATDNANYMKLGVINKAAGAGATAVVDITSANNSTQLTGGSALVANGARAFNLSAVGGALSTAPNDCLEVSLTVVGTLANTLPNAVVKIELTIDG